MSLSSDNNTLLSNIFCQWKNLYKCYIFVVYYQCIITQESTHYTYMVTEERVTQSYARLAVQAVQPWLALKVMLLYIVLRTNWKKTQQKTEFFSLILWLQNNTNVIVITYFNCNRWTILPLESRRNYIKLYGHCKHITVQFINKA